MAALSAGILLYRRVGGGAEFEVFLAHPGGPIWQNKDLGAWTIPKGLIEAGEEELDAAIREFNEETGFEVAGPFQPLGEIVQKNKKVVVAWACEGEADPSLVKSNLTQIWLGGRWLTIPEIDRCAWFPSAVGLQKINAGQAELIVRLAHFLSTTSEIESSDSPQDLKTSEE